MFRPSVGGLSFPEYVIYRGEQVTSESALRMQTLERKEFSNLLANY
jgi:hypothetical protein